MNGVRASHGLPALRTNRALARAADAHSKSMQRTNRIGHGAFSKRLRRYVRTRTVGENVAWMSGCDANAIVQLWDELRTAPARDALEVVPAHRRRPPRGRGSAS